ncbi:MULTISPECIES: fimbrial biogenesis usher protein [Citrobacter]|uniref:fimbrial biogenesis usher protein n=1 Tax=Citrobacter TaxID=544 RepID=UPI000E3D5E37|nr:MULTISPECIES: fimbrial biogenesis usher protein [Citrobacter]MBD0828623.1 fimbrial biogenesis usher protein [Citrobacter sp. C1]RFU91514.1 fimbrial protein [Citrobacter gillenii]
MYKKTLLASLVSLLLTHNVRAEGIDLAAVDFDQETLKSLGVNPNVAHYFSSKSRYMPGSSSVSLNINGIDKGSVIARFDDNGQLCFDKEFLQQAGLKVPSDYESGCYPYEQAYSGTVVDASPAQEKLTVVVPADAVIPVGADMSGYASGGTAALLNYSLMSSRNEFNGGSADYSQALLDGGLNFNDWLLRSHQLLSRSDGKFNSENSSTYMQRTFTGIKSTARFGEVNLNNILLQGAGIYGVELSPENALTKSGGNVQVQGIANTAQARVEVRQQNVLIFSTLVPAGAFTLTDIPMRNLNSDLNVTVVETDGSQHSYVVPASLYNQTVGSAGGLYLSVGRVNDDYDHKPWVMSAAGGWQLNSRINTHLGALAAEDYQAIAGSVDTLPLADLTLGMQVNQTNDTRQSLQGQKYTVSANYAAPYGFGLTTSYSRLTQDYREFSDSLDEDFDETTKNEYSAGINWSHPLIGGLSASFYETKGYDSINDSRYVSAGWSKSFRYFSASINWQHQISAGGDDDDDDVNEDDGDLFYVNISIPLGNHSVNTYSRRDDHKTRYGASAMGTVSENTSYSVGAEHDQAQSQNNFNAGISSNLHYTQLGLNTSMGSEHNRSYSGTLQGGVAAHSQGVTFSPWAIRDTFAIASLDKPVSGIKLDTPQGPVWTDYRGMAVIPSVGAWRTSRVEVNTETLPKNMDIGNGTRMLKQGRGAVGRVGFSAVTQRRALLTVTLADGRKLPKGLAVSDNEGRYLTTSVDEGVVFLNDVTPQQLLTVQLDNSTCQFALNLPEQANPDVFYETAKGVCQ